MISVFRNLKFVIGSGIALVAVIAFSQQGEAPNYYLIMRWAHVMCGTLWLGHLYYINFTQIPSMQKIPMELRPAVSQYIAPRALYWLRWGALTTVITGVVVLNQAGYAYEAFALEAGYRTIGIGMYLACVMAFNVFWFAMRPSHKASELVKADEPAWIAAAARAMFFSRSNTLLSIPMLYCMITAESGF